MSLSNCHLTQLFIHRRMGLRLAGENEMHLMCQEQFAGGLMTMQIVSQDRHIPWRKAPSMAGHPTLDGPLLTVLFLVTILRRDELWLQADHMLLLRRTQDG